MSGCISWMVSAWPRAGGQRSPGCSHRTLVSPGTSQGLGATALVLWPRGPLPRQPLGWVGPPQTNSFLTAPARVSPSLGLPLMAPHGPSWPRRFHWADVLAGRVRQLFPGTPVCPDWAWREVEPRVALLVAPIILPGGQAGLGHLLFPPTPSHQTLPAPI